MPSGSPGAALSLHSCRPSAARFAPDHMHSFEWIVNMRQSRETSGPNRCGIVPIPLFCEDRELFESVLLSDRVCRRIKMEEGLLGI